MQHTKINLPAIVILSTHSFNPPTHSVRILERVSGARARTPSTLNVFSPVRFVSPLLPNRTHDGHTKPIKVYGRDVEFECTHRPFAVYVRHFIYWITSSQTLLFRMQNRARGFLFYSPFFSTWLFFGYVNFFVTVCDRSSFIRPLTIRFPL